MLGAVRIFQPVHGYLVRRELVSWEVDRWANLNPGSVYNALQKLSRDGLLVAQATAPGTMGAARTTTYALTHEGEAEFVRLVRSALSTLDKYAADTLLAGVAFMWALPRAEVITSLESRLAQFATVQAGTEALLESVRSSDDTPDHVQEIHRLVIARLAGEAAWSRELVTAISGGAYDFAGEPGQIPSHRKSAAAAHPEALDEG